MFNLVIRVHNSEQATKITVQIVDLYAEVFAEPPYNEGADDVDAFAELLDIEIPQPAFRLVTGHIGEELIGFGYGYALRAQTRWWEGITPTPAPEFTAERDGRTFAIKELAVRARWRRRSAGRRLHDALIANRTEERATLACRPDATAAVAAYTSWGWCPIGTFRPTLEALDYRIMVHSL
jgi:ribosomal protein S18 acetylase RimI-like enzyme